MSAAPSRLEWFWRLARLARKELRETLRDRRTILTLVLMPVLVYPLLSVGFRQIFMSAATSLLPSDAGPAMGGDAGNPLRIALRTERERQVLDRALVESDRWIKKYLTLPDGKFTSSKEPSLGLVGTDLADDVQEALRDGRADVGVKIDGISKDPNAPPTTLKISIFVRPASTPSRELALFIERRLQVWNEAQARIELAAAGKASIPPAAWSVNEIEEPAQDGLSLASLIPLVLILMTITGAVYPSIDLTAGERERGTLEALMAAPVPRLQLLLAKYIAVLTVALMTAIVNLAAMLSTIYGASLQHLVFGEKGLSWHAVGQVLLLLLLFAAFFSALLLALTSFARSFKEAQAYLIPLMLISLAPGFLTIMPNLRMNPSWSIAPLANIALLARDVLQDKVQPREATMAVFSSMLYAMAALGIAAKVFGSDSILYGSQASWGDLLRKPDKLPLRASIVGALLGLALMFPLQVMLKGIMLSDAQSMKLLKTIQISAVLTAILYGLFPVILARLQHVPIRTGFQVRRFPLIALPAAILLGCAMWLWCHEIVVLLDQWGIAPLQKPRLEAFREKLKEFQFISPGMLVICFGVVPGICEEWFFRGFLQGAFVKRLSGPWGVVAAAVAFGLFHVLSEEQLTLVRLLPSTLMGLVLGLICWRSGSVLPGMLLHVTHNSLLVLMARYPDFLKKSVIGTVEVSLDKPAHLPLAWLGASLLAVLIGLALCFWMKPPTIDSDRQPNS